MLEKQFAKAMARAIKHISQEAIQETGKLKLVETGQLRRSIDSRWKTRFLTRDEWRRAHADSTIPPLVYIGPNGEQIIR